MIVVVTIGEKEVVANGLFAKERMPQPIGLEDDVRGLNDYGFGGFGMVKAEGGQGDEGVVSADGGYPLGEARHIAFLPIQEPTDDEEVGHEQRVGDEDPELVATVDAGHDGGEGAEGGSGLGGLGHQRHQAFIDFQLAKDALCGAFRQQQRTSKEQTGDQHLQHSPCHHAAGSGKTEDSGHQQGIEAANEQHSKHQRQHGSGKTGDMDGSYVLQGA